MRYFTPAFIIKYINAYKRIGRSISRFALDDTHLQQLWLTTHVHTLLIYVICFMWQIMAALSHHSESEARERMYIYNMQLWTHWSQHDCHRSPRPPLIHIYTHIWIYILIAFTIYPRSVAALKRLQLSRIKVSSAPQVIALTPAGSWRLL